MLSSLLETNAFNLNSFPGFRAAHLKPPRIEGSVLSPAKAVSIFSPLAILCKNSKASTTLDLPLALVPISTVKGSSGSSA